jgi:hypothetical protein
MQTYPKAELKHWAGEYYNEKEKSILRKIGLNKNQLEHYVDKVNSDRYYGSYYENALANMREWFGNDLSHIDMLTFGKYLEGFKQIRTAFWGRIRDSAIQFGLEYKRFVKNLIRLGEKNEQAYRLASDTIGSAR